MYDKCLQDALALPPLSRRRGPRMSVDGIVTVEAASPNAPGPLRLRDFSYRGFAIDTARSVAPQTKAQFTFIAAGQRFTAVAVAVHCHQAQDQERHWVSGWEFPEQPGLDAAVDRLLDLAVGVLSVE